jgi:uncharacterized protein (TIGR00255 family)
MIKSMTGFGRASVGRGQNKIDAEIRSVNSRFLEIKIRGISLEPSVEHEIKSIIEETLYRGNVQVRLESKKSQDEQRLNFNKERFELIQDILKNIHVLYGQRLSLSDIISTNDLLKINEEVNINNNSIINSVKKALNQLCEMRKQEGEQIYKDISKRLDILKSKLSNTENLANNYSTEKQSQLKNKVSELLKGEQIDESRLIQEVAYYADRADITEEIVRCKSHFEQLVSYIEFEEPVGKRISFLLQEVGREINTIGSKSPQTDVTLEVVEMKGEIEKVREQAQNIL